jgi:hypothetical protein
MQVPVKQKTNAAPEGTALVREERYCTTGKLLRQPFSGSRLSIGAEGRRFNEAEEHPAKPGAPDS